jgi:hypothetical protein
VANRIKEDTVGELVPRSIRLIALTDNPDRSATARNESR